MRRPLSTLAGVGLIASGASGYTWPASTDHLETLLYEHNNTDVFQPAGVILPCGPDTPFGQGRNTAAEWLRTAYHDMATADKAAGLGGIDGSIGFELDRPENVGSSFSETLNSLKPGMTRRTSMADLIALGAVLAVAGCSEAKAVIPLRGGRIDATGPEPSGVPVPEQDLDTHTAIFAKQGFTQQEMIGLVACGHTIGGVHGVDFPDIVDGFHDEGDNTQPFDTTNLMTGSFDNSIAVEFVNNGTQDALAFGHNETTNSDHRIFTADGGKMIQQMADSNDFFLQTCTTLIEKMLNVVPKEVTLSDVVNVIPVKPSKLFTTINSDGTMTVEGTIRLVDNVPSRSVKVLFRTRSGDACSTSDSCAVPSADAVSASFVAPIWEVNPSLVFEKYTFSATIPISQGISGFDVQVANPGGASTTYDNGGDGFPIADAILPQPHLSCQANFITGTLKLTVAVRDDIQATSVTANLDSPTSGVVLPVITSTPLTLTKGEAISGSGYTLYSINYSFDAGLFGFTRTYDLLAATEGDVVKSEFNLLDELPSCF